MTAVAAVLYEVECSIDPEVVEEFDAWLPGHVREVLSCPGFIDARIQQLQTAADEPRRRRIEYRLVSAVALSNYLEHDAPRLRADGVARFGERLCCSRRLLTPGEHLQTEVLAAPACLNCDTPVPGQYCPECGQARGMHVLSMREVAGDITHSILHLDSRAWRTLKSLLFRPGELTREFIAGRHQRYLPPFRLYLIISVLFFALTSILPGAEILELESTDDLGLASSINEMAVQTADDPELASRIQDALPGAKTSAEAASRIEAVLATRATPNQAEGTGATPAAQGCNFELGEGWLARFGPALENACKQVRADNGKRLNALFLSTAPKLMFLFLPLMAAIALLFYWRPRRLYVEHLVAYLHTHALIFLLLTAAALVNAVSAIKLPFMNLLGAIGAAMMLYLPYYVFRSMRVVYAEGRWKTSLKFAAMSMIYFVLLGMTILIGLFYSMLQL